MVTTGVHFKWTPNPLLGFDFSLVQIINFFRKIWSLLLTDRVQLYPRYDTSFDFKIFYESNLWQKKNLFYISTMKGINYKMSILCKTTIFRTLLLSSKTFLRKNNEFLPAKGNHNIQRSNPRKQYVSQRIRGLIMSQLIMITNIITCWPCQYCPPKQGNDLRLLQSKDKGSHHEPACSAKV